uniref:Uncharacterized protein n=1 Tax=Strongyloides stercoralis TaxID=6248 RepID=A0AAF5DIQ1_STRER
MMVPEIDQHSFISVRDSLLLFVLFGVGKLNDQSFDESSNPFISVRLLTASNGNIVNSKFGNDYQSMDDKLLETCVYSTFDKKNYFKQDAIFLCFFGQFSSRQGIT